jgi:DNA-binding SARP family transcriptional activator/RecA/RadA recombinase
MRVQVLGPLRVWDGTSWSPVAAAQRRVVLAVLAAELGQFVTVDRLVDEVWGEHPPRSAATTVRKHVMQLRRLGDGGAAALLTHGGGYELRLDDGCLDAVAFNALVAAGRRGLAEGKLVAAAADLAEATALWSGPALSDVPASPTVAAYAARLEQTRLGAVEDLMDAQLRLGRHREVVDELPQLIDEHPLRERLHALQVRALYRCGRHADALAACQRARRLLVDELGLEPGPELRGLERAIVSDEPADAPAVAVEAPEPPAVVPAQLPAVIAGFTGRTSQLKQLDALLGRTVGGEPALVISTVAGAAGVGKTALAVHWAHRVADRFPDGQLYVNLRGYAAGPALSPMDVLARFLPALGVLAKRIPADLDAATGLYRSLLAGRRMLVLLDNAHHPDQVRPLLPASTDCLVVVTSRDRMTGLVARDGAVGIDLDVLTPDEARSLLARLLGPETVAAEPEATARLARLCGYLPLALRIAAAKLTSYPRTRLAEFADQLAGGDRLAALDVDGDPQAGVRVAFDHSYTALSTDARRLFRLLGLVPGPDFARAAAAAIAGLPGRASDQLLDRLASSYLVEADEPGRYRLHDLLRLYAADRAAAEDGEPDRAAALGRLYDHYLGRVDAAARLLHPQMLRLPMPAGMATDSGFRDHTEALGWLDRERANLVAAVRHAAENGHQESAWRLADALRGYLFLGVYTVDWLVVAEAGLAAAVADRDVRARAAAHLNLATLHGTLGRYRLAIDDYTTAGRLSRAAGWREGESAARSNLAFLASLLGELSDAVEHFEAALAIARELGWTDAEATILAHLGVVWMMRGRLELAVDYSTQALRLHRQTHSSSGEANTVLVLGELHYLAGRLDKAERALTDALALLRATGLRLSESYALATLGMVHHTAGRYQQAHELAAAGLATAEQAAEPRTQCQVLLCWVEAHQDLHHHRRAVAASRRALRLARASQACDLETSALVRLADTLRHAGHPQLAVGAASNALAIAQRTGYRLYEGEALTVLAAGYLDSDQLEPALDHAERAIAVNSETGRRWYEARARLVASAARDRLGHFVAADAHRRQAGAILADIGVPPVETLTTVPAVHSRLTAGPAL